MDTGQERFGNGHVVPTSEMLRDLISETDHDAIITHAPKQPFRLGYFSTACLIINRVIGTGIFNGPGTVIRGTQSAGGAMLLWFAGCLYGLAGMHVYVEYGLNVPRYVIDGIEQAVPRSGGDLHYLQYVYRWWYYKKDTVLFIGCLFGISFICLGNMAGNSIAFAARVLAAANPDEPEPRKEVVRAVALAAAAFACVIHSVSRRGGIWLSNLFACIKVLILLAIVVLAGLYKQSVIVENLNSANAFQKPKMTAGLEGCGAPPDDGNNNGYAKAFLSIVFAFSGFDQANYVLGEVSRPRRTFPRAAFFAMGLISVMYMVVNICYMAVVTAYEQQIGASGGCPSDKSVEDVALLFFKKALKSTNNTPDRVFNALLAVSSFGNIIVMTYTAARMKQEIAKQGFIPFPQFFGRNVDLSIGRLVVYLRQKANLSLRFMTPENHREPTPVGALMLHFASCIVLIYATFGMATNHDAYSLLTSLGAYLITAFFGSFLALGILILRFAGPPQPEIPPEEQAHQPGGGPPRKTWREMTKGSVNPYLSVICAVIYLLFNLFPVIASCVPQVNSSSGSTFEGWLVPAISCIVLAVSAAWWLGFLGVARYRSRRQQKEFVYEVRPEFDWADPEGDGAGGEGGRRDEGKILAHETVLLAWVGGEMSMFATGQNMNGQHGYMEGLGSGVMRQRQKREQGMMVSVDENPLAGTDFDSFGPAQNTMGAGWQGNGNWRT
ncbi:amino acid permease-domain-containing protein [Cercophora newfieldiana]|uniref:Amino acid permease-domain-containing protein n=1 Tax=Cercophora newfieldiana TaxID=92897 RepID=A0AA39Y5Q6_9PEZI|nr:amino acid permease-domain-containing protein [Cercophora newfieldiana]